MTCGVARGRRVSGKNEIVCAHGFKNSCEDPQSCLIYHAITMRSHERHVVWNHPSFDCLCNRLCGPASKKHQSPCYWVFVRGNRRWPVNSPHSGPVTRQKYPFDDVMMRVCKSTNHITEHETNHMIKCVILHCLMMHNDNYMSLMGD